MTMPVPHPVPLTAIVAGLSPTIDGVAERGAASHRFLRRGWYAAALAAYGGAARTLVVGPRDAPVLALPFVPVGPGMLRFAAVPGSYWPFRSFPSVVDVSDAAMRAALAALAGAVNGLRIGPVLVGDASVAPVLAAARASGWAVIDRFVADGWSLDLTASDWPRGSTLRKNRFHEKHLATHGGLDWAFMEGADWPDGFATLGAVEDRSWIVARTDGGDAKFTEKGHLAFWRAAAADPVLAAMFRAAVLRVDGTPAAFSFDIDCGTLKYAIANSYDPAFARHSPGKLLYYRNLIAARGRGIVRVDWGAGDSGYKQTLGAVQGAAIRDWLLLRPGIPAVIGRMLAGVWRRSGQG